MAADQPIPPADGALPAPPPAGFRHFVSDVAAFARWRLAGVMALAMVAAAAEGMGLVMLVPILSMAGVGGGNGDTAAVGLEWGLALYVALVAAASAVVALRGVAATSLRLGYGSHLRSRLHRALCRMEWRTFTRMAGAEATHALTVDAPQATLGVEFLLRLAGWTFEIPALLFVALHLSPALSLTALGLGALLLVLARPLNRRAHALGRQAGQASRALQADLTDDLAGMRVIRALGLEGVRHGRFEQSSRNVQAGQMAYQRSSATARAAMQALAAGLAAVAVWVAF
ncbi:MAG TPA: ABC transporter transmembrane domain-containing protein, partial [Magnetospirillum sp.]|nr:ABC transporter transmembrane domain-containing protein [Magnetospirillum sp.]